MIRVLSPATACASLAEQLGHASKTSGGDEAAWHADLMRRICAINCPIPRGKLVRVSRDLLADLADETTALGEIEFAIDGLFASGDLMEIADFRSCDEHYSGDWVFLAPPSFVLRESGRIYIFGIAPDDAPILPLRLREAIENVGPYRYISQGNEEAIDLLRLIGMREVPESIWLTVPKKQTPEQLMKHMSMRLSAAPPAGILTDLRILHGNGLRGLQYRDRWRNVQGESGCFVGRRPGGYGSEKWCYVKLNNGTAASFVDLPWPGARLRGCDAGWQLQLAIDAAAGNPATYKIQKFGNDVSVRFSFPIPFWARRRFHAVGNDSIMSSFEYGFTHSEWPAEQRFIEEYLWFVSE